MTAAQEKVHALALERFRSVGDHDQRKRELDDLKFDAGEQWPEEVQKQRAGQTIDGVAIPPRPMLTIPKLDQPVQLVINQAKAAHLGIQIHPESDDATDDTAEVLQGLIRRIEVHSRASMARNWAFERAAKCGRGFYRVLTQHCQDGGDPFDQELVIKRILNQSSVYLDPHAEEPDWSDGEWGFIGGFMAGAQFERDFPDAENSVSEAEAFVGLGDAAPDWVGEINGKRTVRVMEYFVVTKTVQTITSGDQSRDVETRTVTWYKLNGLEILEEQAWDGQYIPIIPVIGREQNIDGDRRFVGIIGPAKDSARLLNYMVSNAVETAALEPRAPYIGFEGQFEGHETAWQQANVRNFPYLQVRPMTIGGQPAPFPERNVAGANLMPSLQLIQQADEFIKASTFSFDPSLGNTSPKERSGKAVLALQQQADAGNSHYLDNLADIAMTYEAKVLLDLIPRVYDRPGRLARILGTDDEPDQVMLNAPYMKGQDGKPQAVAPQGQQPVQPQGPQQPGSMLNLQGAGGKAKTKHHDLTKGTYSVAVSVGKSYQTRLQQGNDQLGQILQADPSLMPILGDIWFKFQEWPGHTEASDRMKKLRPPQLQDEGDQEQQAQQLKQQRDQAAQMVEMLGKELDAKNKILETDQIKNDGQYKIAKLNQETALLKTQQDNETKIAVAELGAKVDRLSLFLEERARIGVQGHDASMAHAQSEHDLVMAQQAAAQQSALAAQGHDQALQQGEQGQQHALEQGQQAADLAPEPQAAA